MTKQENLELQIKTYDANYRAGTPLCSDEAYDKLVEELAKEFPNSELLGNGVIQQPIKLSRKEQLPIPMFSMNKIKTLEELKKWLTSCGAVPGDYITITAKYDGISMVDEYDGQKAWTRGNGIEGQLSTKHFRSIINMSEDCADHKFGEVLISKSMWKFYFEGKENPETGETYKNARNTIAGLFNKDEVNELLLSYATFIPYGVGDERGYKYKSQILEDLGNSRFLIFTVEALLSMKEEDFTKLYETLEPDFACDGLILEFDSVEKRKSLGREKNNNPAYARALKLPSWTPLKTSKVKGIKWEVSKDSRIKPVIQIEPVVIDGVTIESVSGYNFRYIIDNNLAKGSLIELIRSGDVIPKHINTVSYEEENVADLLWALEICPCCSHETHLEESGVDMICTNKNCKEKEINEIMHFFNVLKFEEIGKPTIEKIHEAGFTNIKDVLYKMKKQDFLNIDGLGESSWNDYFNQIKALKVSGVPLAKICHASNLFRGEIGEKDVQLIFDSMDEGYWVELVYSTQYINESAIEILSEIKGIGEKKAISFIKGMQKIDHSPEHLDLSSYLGFPISYVATPKQEIVGNMFEGFKICFTGVRPSEEQKSIIESQGGEIVSGVSKKTTHLILSNLSDTTSKAEKARSLGIELIEFETFAKQLKSI